MQPGHPSPRTQAAFASGRGGLPLALDSLGVDAGFVRELVRAGMVYRFGIDEMVTKIQILKDEFTYIHSYSPIEHVSSRVKSPDAILDKARRRGIPLELDAIRAGVLDIAGIRVTCSFISDTYWIRDMIASQADVTVHKVKDYIAHPKANGYQSLHLIAEVPVFLSDRTERVPVEIQIRTIAMDFWASLEHKIYYKYDGAVPERMLGELRDAATVASSLDVRMERLHDEMRALRDEVAAEPGVSPTEWSPGA